MNHLCYINIFDYRNLHNVDMSFDSRYDFSLDRNRNVLSIEKRKGVPDVVVFQPVCPKSADFRDAVQS